MSAAPAPRRGWRPDWFLLGMLGAALLAWQLPGPGARDGVLHAEILTKVGVALIFFLHGLVLSFESLKAGTLRWPVHLMVQGCTFLFFPLLGLAALPLIGPHVSPDLALGFFFLCALPSTVSSSVALTAMARGNVPVAVFNATVSNLAGVVLTPLWVGAVTRVSQHDLPIAKVILELCVWLVLPLVLGQVFRRWLGPWAGKNKKFIHTVDRGTILLLVYTSLCDSVQQGTWSSQGGRIVALTVAGVGLVFVLAMLAMRTACRLAHFSREDSIAAMFCGSKKTLATGVSMAQLMFGGHPGLGLILLPIMLYHPLQLVACTVLARRWAEQE